MSIKCTTLFQKFTFLCLLVISGYVFGNELEKMVGGNDCIEERLPERPEIELKNINAAAVPKRISVAWGCVHIVFLLVYG